MPHMLLCFCFAGCRLDHGGALNVFHLGVKEMPMCHHHCLINPVSLEQPGQVPGTQRTWTVFPSVLGAASLAIGVEDA